MVSSLKDSSARKCRAGGLISTGDRAARAASIQVPVLLGPQNAGGGGGEQGGSPTHSGVRFSPSCGLRT